MNALQEFKFNENSIRVVMIENTPWWVAKDVFDTLSIEWRGYGSLVPLESDEIGVHQINTAGGSQSLYIINESGIYTIIMRSTKPNAKAFRKWVTSEVLPQIRKTGSYSLPSDPHDQVLMLCEKLTAMALEAKQLTLKIAEQQPAVDAWHQFVDTDGLIDMVYVAQTCGVGKNRLYKKLREEKVFHYDSEYNAVYQQYIDRGYFDVRFVSNKNIGNIPVIRCTPKGAEWIYNKFYRRVAA